jgi:hypothetical protein
LFYPPNVAPSPCPVTTTGIAEAAMVLESEVRETNGAITDILDLRKSRLSWTMQLHRQFITAVNSLGPESKWYGDDLGAYFFAIKNNLGGHGLGGLIFFS